MFANGCCPKVENDIMLANGSCPDVENDIVFANGSCPNVENDIMFANGYCSRNVGNGRLCLLLEMFPRRRIECAC